jgi:hypothetical protein
MKFCSSTSEFQNICKDNYFWYSLYKYESGKNGKNIGEYTTDKDWESEYLNSIWNFNFFNKKGIDAITLIDGSKLFNENKVETLGLEMSDFFDFTNLLDAKIKENDQTIYFLEVPEFEEYWVVNSIMKSEYVNDASAGRISIDYLIFVIEMFKDKNSAIDRFANSYVSNLDLNQYIN